MSKIQRIDKAANDAVYVHQLNTGAAVRYILSNVRKSTSNEALAAVNATIIPHKK